MPAWGQRSSEGTLVDSKGHILLVEDSQDDIELTLRALNRNPDLAITVVRDGAEALGYLLGEGEHAGRALPDLVLLDINLPKLSGLEVLKALRGNAETALLPVVMLTTSREERDVMESYRGGANSYVRKPVNYAEFVEAVNQLGLYWLHLNEAPWPARS